VQCPLDSHLARFQIEVGPLQAEHFALSHSGRDGENVKRFMAIAAYRIEKQTGFVLVEETNLRQLFRRIPRRSISWCRAGAAGQRS
jgi:hypothetical protein